MAEPEPLGPTRSGSRRGSIADDLLDRVVPEELDWRHLVRRYPLPSLLAVGLGGFLLGRHRGAELLAAAAAFSAQTVDEMIEEFTGQLQD